MKKFLSLRFALVACLVVASFATGSCSPTVILVPNETDLVTLNGCVVSACNYLAAVKTQHRLDSSFWAKVLLVRYKDHPAGHAYCVWETEGTIYGYDRNAGGYPIPVYTRDPKAIATVLAQGLSKVLKEELSVAQADFVEPRSATVAKY